MLSFFCLLVYNFNEVIDMNNDLIIPKHVGIIMDGNGRWAQEKGMPRTMGHSNAIKTLKALCLHMADVGVKYASLYAFSTENFKRDVSEVEFLNGLFKDEDNGTLPKK
jgi:undecaprenyl diphosphate synthase